jgi:hypothetical protein
MRLSTSPSIVRQPFSIPHHDKCQPFWCYNLRSSFDQIPFGCLIISHPQQIHIRPKPAFSNFQHLLHKRCSYTSEYYPLWPLILSL